MFKHLHLVIPEAIPLPGFFGNIRQYIWKRREKKKASREKPETELIGPVTAWVWEMKEREVSNFTLRYLVWLTEWKTLLTEIENRGGKGFGQQNELSLETQKSMLILEF